MTHLRKLSNGHLAKKEVNNHLIIGGQPSSLVLTWSGSITFNGETFFSGQSPATLAWRTEDYWRNYTLWAVGAYYSRAYVRLVDDTDYFWEVSFKRTSPGTAGMPVMETFRRDGADGYIGAYDWEFTNAAVVSTIASVEVSLV